MIGFWQARSQITAPDLKKKHAIRLRITLAPDTLLGPGKADLLEGIKETGSIPAAGRRMGMSYKRAWYLLDTMNTCFRERLATATKGGKSGGGAQLTDTGLAVLATFRRMEAAAERGCQGNDEARRINEMTPAK
jgi:molybdate transport system regulatory protein